MWVVICDECETEHLFALEETARWWVINHFDHSIEMYEEK